MQFCPTCANVLLMENGSEGLRFFCQTCPYIFNITSKVTRKMVLKHKPVEEVIDEKAWSEMEKTDARCPQCDYGTASFVQISTSANEKARTFYRCLQCKYRWSDN